MQPRLTAEAFAVDCSRVRLLAEPACRWASCEAYRPSLPWLPRAHPPVLFCKRTTWLGYRTTGRLQVAVLTALRVLRWQRLLPATLYTRLSKNNVPRKAHDPERVAADKTLATLAGRTLSGPLPSRLPAAAPSRGLRGSLSYREVFR
jgi:hypothetical protein